MGQGRVTLQLKSGIDEYQVRLRGIVRRVITSGTWSKPTLNYRIKVETPHKARSEWLQH